MSAGTPSEGLSRFNIWRLNKAANSNPVKDLLQNDGRKADLASDFASLFSALASGLAAAVAVYAAYYVIVLPLSGSSSLRHHQL